VTVELNNTKSGLPHDKLIRSAISGLKMKPEEMEQRLNGASEAIREDIQSEMDTINWFHTAILYWKEHGMWEAVREHYETSGLDQ
jgi:hypothetical protein